MVERHQAGLQQAASFLKSNYFDGYMNKLKELSELDSKFTQWLDELAKQTGEEEASGRQIK
ncbi:MAG: hypothetical protein LPD71_03680 [Shewanella sp.]|nr:hypothetical protein [Shewanella sp.]MCF1431251.1 hypothetical protein [Shewanella sp.]MCF1437866.1 hypothetical protein [Shewanella sp.]MCF1457320.1 hypothetical protein [Shewanella sp.]